MDKKEKTVRLVDVGKLESSLKKDLAEEKANGKSADILFCESIEDELSDLENLPTIDPASLQPRASWTRPAELTIIVPAKKLHEEPVLKCSRCGCMISETEYKLFVWNYCPVCGAKMDADE